MELPALISLAWFWTKESSDTVSHKTRRQFPHLFKLERYQTTLLLLLLLMMMALSDASLFFFLENYRKVNNKKYNGEGR